jgi:hypothetical protein
MCILPNRTLRLAGGLSGQFFSPLSRFVPSVLKGVIVLIDAFLFWRTRISQICQLPFYLLSSFFLSLSNSTLTVGSELYNSEQSNHNCHTY